MDQTLGQIAYSGYYQFCRGKSKNDYKPLPLWKHLVPRERFAWEAAANAVATIMAAPDFEPAPGSAEPDRPMRVGPGRGPV